MNHFIHLMHEEWQEFKKKPLSFLGWFCGILSAVGMPILYCLQKIPPTGVVFAESILLCILLWKHYKLRSESVRLKDLYNNNVPMISTLSYIMNARKREEYNRFTILDVKIKYRFDIENAVDNTVMQTITWDFHIENQTQQAITKMVMMVSKSVFSRYRDIEISALDTETNRPLNVNLQQANGAQRYIEIIFENTGILAGGICNCQLKLQWRTPYKFREPEFIIVDPINYSIDTRIIQTVFETNCDFLAGVPVTYLAVGRKNLTYKNDEYNTRFEPIGDGLYSCNREFHPNSKKLYLIRINYKAR